VQIDVQDHLLVLAGDVPATRVGLMRIDLGSVAVMSSRTAPIFV
jgi:hypothetical protein